MPYTGLMDGYSNILVAVDLSSESHQLVRAANNVACEDCSVHLLYVQEPLDSVYMGVVPYGPVFVGMDAVEENLKKELRGKLDALGDEFGVPHGRRHFLNGTASREIHRFAEEHDTDLIVLGTHGQKGVQLLLGSTANSVLHGASCDVLAVRIRED